MLDKERIKKGLALMRDIAMSYASKPNENKEIEYVLPERWMPDSPLVSVVIPCYNYGRFLGEAVESVLNQTFQDLEIIIVNDGSTDEHTLKVLEEVEKWSDKITVYHQENSGPSEARNNGIRIAKGKYICALDADDLIHPTYLEKCVYVLEAYHDVGFVYSWVKIFGTEDGYWKMPPFDPGLLFNQNIVSVSAVFRKRAWRQVGGYRKIGYEDWEFWMRLTRDQYKGFLIPEVLFFYRRHGGGVYNQDLARHNKIIQQLEQFHGRIRKHWKLYSRVWKYRHKTSIYKTPYVNIKPNSLKLTNNTKRIGVILPWLPIGGAEYVMLYIIKGFAEKGYDVEVITTLEHEHQLEDLFAKYTNGRIYHIANYAKHPALKVKLLQKIVKAHKYDAIIMSGSELGYIASQYLREDNPNLPIINIIHNSHELGWARLSSMYDPYIDVHVAVGLQVATDLYEKFSIPSGKIKMIINGVDTDMFNPTQDVIDKAEALRRELGISEDSLVLGYVGRLSFEKNIEAMLSLVEKLHSQFKDKVHLLLIGPFENQHMYDKLKNKLNKPVVKYVGPKEREELPVYYALMDVFILTSLVEGLPLVLLEALAMGKITIAPSVGAIPWLFKHIPNAFLVNDGNNLDEYIAIIKKLLSKRKNELIEMGIENRNALIDIGLTVEGMQRKYISLLNAFLRHKSISEITHKENGLSKNLQKAI